jgi:hypothetical protein
MSATSSPLFKAAAIGFLVSMASASVIAQGKV